MKSRSPEFLVGLWVLAVIVLMGVFAWLLGVADPFSKTMHVHVLYDFAGGVEMGSPVRVAGVKVGKVEQIVFIPKQNREGANASLRVTVSISPAAAPAVRQDSKFFINMAGIIGERYIEVSPGSAQSPLLTANVTVRGEDPPRVDQLLSQGYGVFNGVLDILEKNEEQIAQFVQALPVFLTDAAQFMKRKDWEKVFKLLDNLNGATDEVRLITSRFKSPRLQENIDKLNHMIDRAYEVDGKTLKQFLQEDGIRARIF